MGNGICDAFNNFKECDFDGGDCVMDCINVLWIADGFCDDLTNEPSCQLDGGDCCGLDANYELCMECQCKDPNQPTIEPLPTDTTTVGPSTTPSGIKHYISIMIQYIIKRYCSML